MDENARRAGGSERERATDACVFSERLVIDFQERRRHTASITSYSFIDSAKRHTTPERIRSVVFDLQFKLCTASSGENICLSHRMLDTSFLCGLCSAELVILLFGGSGQ